MKQSSVSENWRIATPEEEQEVVQALHRSTVRVLRDLKHALRDLADEIEAALREIG